MIPNLEAAPLSDPESDEPDFLIENHFSLFLLWPLSSLAHAWIHENVSEDRQWFGEALVVEPRYVSALIVGIVADGLTFVGEGGARQ